MGRKNRPTDAEIVRALENMCKMAMHAPLDAGHGLDQSHIDRACDVRFRISEYMTREARKNDPGTQGGVVGSSR